MIDGLGAVKIVAHCIKQYYDTRLILRKAEIKDMYDIYELSNSPDVRQNSFHPDKIELETHKKWFVNKLNDPRCIFLVSKINDTFIGQIRFEKDEEKAIISISTVSGYRGFGIGKIVAQKAFQYLKIYHPDIQYVTAC